jgi:type I restriction enzyme S subunit
VEWARVRDIAEQIRGVTYSKADAVSSPAPGYLPVLRASNITHTGLDFSDLVYVPAHRISARQKVRVNDVVVAASSGSIDVVGKAARSLSDLEGGFGAFCKVLRPTAHVDPAYFAHYFQTRAYRRLISSLATGASINNLKNGHLDDLRIRLPSLDEQRRIAAILDQADALRAKRRCTKTYTRELVRALLQAAVDDPSTRLEPLGDLADFQAGGTLPEGTAFTGQDGGNLLMKVSDMNTPGNERQILACAAWSDQPGARSATCPAGSVVIPKRGGSIGTNKKRLSTRSMVLDPNLMAITPRPRIAVEYLYAWFEQFDLTTLISGSSVPQLNKQDLAPLLVPLPTAECQQVFAKRARAIENIAESQDQQLGRCEDLFVNLQARAFDGEL